MYSNVECPYCEKEQEINHDDGYGYEEDEVYQQQCDFCDKVFAYTTSIHFTHNANKADCLNEGEHEWKRIATTPIEYTTMGCTMCDERRKPTEDEWKLILNKEI